jgi:hypothetical protein
MRKLLTIWFNRTLVLKTSTDGIRENFFSGTISIVSTRRERTAAK